MRPIATLGFGISLLKLATAQFSPPNPPQTSQMTSNGTILPLSNAAAILCDHQPAWGRPTQRDCYNALLAVPQDERVYTFRQQDLPAFASGTCIIHLNTLPHSESELSSWLYINLRATQLILSCGDGMPSEATTGGVVGVGEHGRIAITVLHARREAINTTEATRVD